MFAKIHQKRKKNLTYGFRENIFAKCAQFRFALAFFTSFIFALKCENWRKNLQNTKEIFRIFLRNVLFAANPNWNQ